MLTCDQVQELLWPLDRPREYSEDEAAARAHLRDCRGCQGFFERDAVVTGILERHAIGASAPAGLREKVFDALARERALFGTGGRSERRRRPRSLVAAATALVAIGLSATALWFTGVGGRSVIDGAYAEDFVSRAMEAEVVESPDPQEVSRFFLQELGVRVVPMAVDAGKLSHAGICLIEGRRTAMVQYEMDGRKVAHYRLPAAAEPLAGDHPLQTVSARGVQVTRWTDESFEHALVSELSENELEKLARGAFAAR